MSKILGVKIDNLNFLQTLAKIERFLGGNRLRQIVTVNPEFIVSAQYDREFRRVLNNADLSVPDGFGLQIAAKILGQKIGERLTGVDLTWEIAKIAAERGERLFLLGGSPGIANKTGKRLKIVYPRLKIAGAYGGKPNEKGIIEKINRARPDILLVAFGAPKQDIFINQNRTRLQVKIAMGVGGTFDYISRNIPRAPKCLRVLGLEWLFRLIREPRRIKRILRAVVVFPVLVILSKLRHL